LTLLSTTTQRKEGRNEEVREGKRKEGREGVSQGGRESGREVVRLKSYRLQVFQLSLLNRLSIY